MPFCFLNKQLKTVLSNYVRSYYIPLVEVETSGGILEANPYNTMKYIAQITLSAATPAATTDGEAPSASVTAT